MSEAPELLVERDQGRLSLTLNRPGSANALSPSLTEAMLSEISSAEDIRLCVIRGEGRHFCAGFDLSDIEDLSDGDLLWRFLRIETLLQAVYHAPFPTLALAQGQVVGAGADLFAACWQRIAAPGSKFRMPGWNFELALGTRRLTGLIGTDAARDMLVDTRVLDSETALQCGLASQVADIDQWPVLVDRLDQRANALPRRALSAMFDITARDTRDQDFASIVRTAGQPGLKQRIVAYREKVQAAKKS